MAIPGIKQTIRDPGLGVTPAAINAAVFFGTCSIGTVNTVYAFSNPNDVIDTLGQGPLAEDLCYELAIAGGPVYAVRLTGSVAGAAGSVTKVAASTSTGTITVAGAAFDAYEAIVKILSTGALGVATFQYSLDNGTTWSPETIVPSGGSYVVANTNLTLTFVAGSGPIIFEKGDVHTFVSTAPSFSATDLNNGMTAFKASNTPVAEVVLAGKFPSSSAGATIAAAMAVQATSLFNTYRYVGFIMDAGEDVEATAQASYAAFSSERASICYGNAYTISAKPFVGYSVPKCSISRAVAARCAAISVSTDPARFATGSLPGVTSITHDEFRTENMDAKKFTTLRTFQGISGFFVTNGRMMSLPGSDYQFWQHRRVMDVASATAYAASLPFLSASVRTITGGTIDPRDAMRWENAVKDALRTVLLDPDNAEGTQGHVSALDAKVDRTNNVLTSSDVKVKYAIRPLGYAKTIENELSFSANVGG
jgi:hypothetical protein